MIGDEREKDRALMVETQIRARGVRDERVLAAMKAVPRHLFVPPSFQGVAYQDSPLPIGKGQTISQPYIVAVMTELLQVKPGDRILEIGSGSGYQAAILGRLAKTVISIERIPEVAAMARDNLERAGATGVRIIIGDGTVGYPGESPYDGIIITAATPSVPQPLVDQLAEGGRLVAPVGGRDLQELLRLTKREGRTVAEHFGGVVFVPLLGEYGWQS